MYARIAMFGADRPKTQPAPTPEYTLRCPDRVRRPSVQTPRSQDCEGQLVGGEVVANPWSGLEKKVAPAPAPVKDSEPQEVWPMTLSDAIRIGLDNCGIVRVIRFGSAAKPIGGFAVHGPTLDEPPAAIPNDPRAHGSSVVISAQRRCRIWRFKAEVMADVRSVEQQYWNLAQAHVQLWAADRAVSMAKEVLEREQPRQIGAAPSPTSPSPRAARAVQPRPGDADLGRHHDGTAAPQPARPAAIRQPADHPGHSGDRAAHRIRLGHLSSTDDARAARCHPAKAPHAAGRAAIADRSQPCVAPGESERPLSAQQSWKSGWP